MAETVTDTTGKVKQITNHVDKWDSLSFEDKIPETSKLAYFEDANTPAFYLTSLLGIVGLFIPVKAISAVLFNYVQRSVRSCFEAL